MACRTPVPEALAIVARGAARVVRVTDAQVEAAMRALFADTHNVAEGAGAAALAGLLADGAREPDAPAAVVLCGGNVDAAVFARVLAGG
jgi:threonine dehydratase